MNDSVIGNRNRRMPPFNRSTNQISCWNHCVHRAHLGMGMKLYSFDLRLVFAFSWRQGPHQMIELHRQFLAEFIKLHSTFGSDPTTFTQARTGKTRGSSFIGEEMLDAECTIRVSNFHGEKTSTAPELTSFDLNDATFDDDLSFFFGDLFHRTVFAFDRSTDIDALWIVFRVITRRCFGFFRHGNRFRLIFAMPIFRTT